MTKLNILVIKFAPCTHFIVQKKRKIKVAIVVKVTAFKIR